VCVVRVVVNGVIERTFPVVVNSSYGGNVLDSEKKGRGETSFLLLQDMSLRLYCSLNRGNKGSKMSGLSVVQPRCLRYLCLPNKNTSIANNS
jgi:hypothetical protein